MVLSLQQKLILRSLASAAELMKESSKGPETPGYIVGWDKATATPIVRRNGALSTANKASSRGVGLNRSIVISAAP